MTTFPRIVPEVYETSDGKLHASEEEAKSHQHRLDFEEPLSRALANYLAHAKSRYADYGLPRNHAFLSILERQGLKIVRADDGQ